MIYFGLFLSSVTELLEQLINVGAFFLSPARIFIVVILYIAFLAYCANGGVRGAILGGAARLYGVSVAILLLLTGASVATSPDVLYSLKRTANATSIYVLPLIVYIYLRVCQKKYPADMLLKNLGRTLVWTGFVVALFGFLQAGTGILRTFTEVRSLFGLPVYRINSVFPDPNFLAYFLVFPWWLAAVGGEDLTGIQTRIFRMAICAIILLAILLTGSRGGFLMIAAVIGSVLVSRICRKLPRAIFSLEAGVVVLLPVVLLVSAYYGFEFIYHHTNAVDTGNESGFSRVLAWYSGLRLYLTHPVMGVGPGNFVTMEKGNFLPHNYIQPWVALRIDTLAGHSNVLETLVESGPLTLAAYFFMQLVVYRTLFRASMIYKDSRFAIFRTLYFAAAVGNVVISYFPIFLMFTIGVLLFAFDRDVVERAPQTAEGRNQYRGSLFGVNAYGR